MFFKVAGLILFFVKLALQLPLLIVRPMSVILLGVFTPNVMLLDRKFPQPYS
jgi:hypothetical protein